jgi:hypothetical protein
VSLIRTDVSEECISSIMSVGRVCKLGITLSGDMFLRSVGSYKHHAASHRRKRHSSTILLFALLSCATHTLPLNLSLCLPSYSLRYEDIKGSGCVDRYWLLSDQIHDTAALPPEIEPPIHTLQEAGWTRKAFWMS